MIKVVIIEDHKLVAEGIAAAINNTDFAEVAGIAHTGKESLEKMKFWNPEIILMDISLPDIKGTDLCTTILEEFPNVKIIALTSHNEFSIVKQMLDKGAKGYVLKNDRTEVIIAALETVGTGGIFISRETHDVLKQPSHQKIILTQREKEILLYISEGLTNSEIAEKIFLSPETIKSYRKNLLFKLDAKNTALLIKKSLELKLI